MKSSSIKNEGKKFAIMGLIAGFFAAGLKARELGGDGHIAHDGPTKLTKSEWKRVLLETKDALGSKNLSSLAAGVAYYSTLAFFPFLAAAVAIAALLITPRQLGDLVHAAEMYLPEDISRVIASQLKILVSRRADNLLAAGIAIAVALFGASGASKNLVIASNVAYGVKETRGWLAQQLWGIAWTAVGIVFGFLVMALLAVNHALLAHLGVPPFFIALLLYGRWLVMVALAVFGLAVFYRYGPDRARVRWQWVSWGAGIATVLWLAVTALFFVYVQHFANYTQSYSLFAGIIILMIWLNFSALIVLLGAEINHRLEIVGREAPVRKGRIFRR